MKIIPQRRTNDCAIACFAMLMGISYERAAWLALSFEWPIYWLLDKTTKIKKLVRASKKLDRELGLYKSKDNFEEFDCKHDAILVLSHNGGLTSHAVIWNAANKAILDPNTHYSHFEYEILKKSEVYLLIEKRKMNG